MKDTDSTIAEDLVFLREMLPMGGSVWISKAYSMIFDEMDRQKYNRQRADQLMRFAIDHALLSEVGHASKSISGPSRNIYARELTENTFGAIEDHRPARKGLLAYVFGK